MRSKTYQLDIDPIAWKRAGRSGNRYYDQQLNEKDSIALLLKKQHGAKEELFSSSIGIEIMFFIKKPIRTKNTYPCVKPDLDNLIKFILDTSNGILFTDDKIICEIYSRKEYDSFGHIEFTIYDL